MPPTAKCALFLTIHTSEGVEKDVKCCILLHLLLFAQVCSEGCVTCGLNELLQTHTTHVRTEKHTDPELDRKISDV